jgi:hypothetical protein
MAELGDHQRLRDPRRVLGRKVRAFISGMDTDKDVAAELFYLTD